MYFEGGGAPAPPGVCPRPRVCVCVQSYLKLPIKAGLSGDKSGAHKHLGTNIATDTTF